jgi:hypothetical protein
MISNCGHDERGKYSGGQAGDQTGTEYCLRSWYDRPWTCVLRYPDAKVRKKIAELAKAAAKNDNIGYDQGQRGTFWVQLQKVGYDPAKIKTKCEADCSSSTIAVIQAAGYLLGIKSLQKINASTTSNIKKGLQDAGFKVLTNEKYLKSDKYLKAGDILLKVGSHVCINVTTGSAA